jgi:hypothetical protein
MSTDDQELQELLGEPSVVDRAPPQLIPWGWRVFLGLLLGFDVVCLLIGRVPWSGGEHGLGRDDLVLAILVGLALGALIALLAEAVAASRAAQIGLTAEEAALAADELSILTRPRRPGRMSFVLLGAVICVLCALFAKFAFKDASLPAATVFVGLHVVTGLAIPVLWRKFTQANYAFEVWVDQKNAAFDEQAAKRAAGHQERLDDITRRIHEAEDGLRERLDRMPRSAPPWYLVPEAMWVPLGLAVVLDLILLFSPGARAIALDIQNASVLRLIWGVLALAIQGCVLIGIIWGFLSWYYMAVSDQISRQWAGRDWSGGLGAVAIELLMAGMTVAILAALLAGWMPRFVVWNLLAPAFLLVGVLRDIRDTAEEHYLRTLKKHAAEAGPTPADDEEAEE